MIEFLFSRLAIITCGMLILGISLSAFNVIDEKAEESRLEKSLEEIKSCIKTVALYPEVEQIIEMRSVLFDPECALIIKKDYIKITLRQIQIVSRLHQDIKLYGDGENYGRRNLTEVEWIEFRCEDIMHLRNEITDDGTVVIVQIEKR